MRPVKSGKKKAKIGIYIDDDAVCASRPSGAKSRRPDFSMLFSAIRYNSRYLLQSGNAAVQKTFLKNRL